MTLVQEDVDAGWWPVTTAGGGDAVAPLARHAHLWVLADGTGLHAPPGTLTREDETGRLCCHLCGRWFRSLGSHVRAHGHTAETYREAMGLCRTRALTGAALSAAISARKARKAQEHACDPEVRSRLAPGQQDARTGALAERARAAEAMGGVRPEHAFLRRKALATGRVTSSERRQAVLQARLVSWGAPDLGEYLRSAYAVGASRQTLAEATGLGRARLRSELRAAGISVRPPGVNTPTGKRSRAEAGTSTAAAKVGTVDLSSWLNERHAAGWSLTELGAVVGHSTHWVRLRLTGPEGETAHQPAADPRGQATRAVRRARRSPLLDATRLHCSDFVPIV